MGRLTFILGGARSGKSTFAESLATKKYASVAYIATAQALDEEMAARIEMHRRKRPTAWQTLEIPLAVGQAIYSNPPDVEVVILDCLTLLVSNLLLRTYGEGEASSEVILSSTGERRAVEAVDRELIELQQAIQEGSADWIVVSNEVGMGLVPPYPQGRLYRDLLGSANQRIASLADRVYFMVAGIPMRLVPEP